MSGGMLSYPSGIIGIGLGGIGCGGVGVGFLIVFCILPLIISLPHSLIINSKNSRKFSNDFLS